MLGRIVTALMLSAALLIPTPAHAIGDFDPPVTVIDPGCDNASVVADAVGGPDGKVYGFAQFSGAGCTHDIWYFKGAGNTWTSMISPYRGRLLAVAHDGTATYLLYTDGRNTRITKRAGGQFTPGRVLGGDTDGGDVIAAGGKWWATWVEGGGYVYQAKTIGFAMLRRLATDIGDRPVFLYGPETVPLSLAARPGGGAVLLIGCCEWSNMWGTWTGFQVLVSDDGEWVPRFEYGNQD